MERNKARVKPQDSTRVMKSSMSFSKKTLFSHSVSSASMSKVLRRMRFFVSPYLRMKVMSVYQRQSVLSDLRGGVEAGQAASGLLHLFEASRIVEQRGNLPGGYGQIVAADGGACFQQMIGVTFFLAGNRLDQNHWERACQSF